MTAWYSKGLQAFGNGEVDWTTDTIKVALLNITAPGATIYTPNLSTDQFLSDIPDTGPGAAIFGTGTLLSTTNVDGLLDAADTVISGVGATSDDIEALVIYKDTGSAATSPLLCYIDSGSGLTIGTAPNGTDITIIWNAGGIAIL